MERERQNNSIINSRSISDPNCSQAGPPLARTALARPLPASDTQRAGRPAAARLNARRVLSLSASCAIPRGPALQRRLRRVKARQEAVLQQRRHRD